MQSFLQYHKFGRAVEDQQKRYKPDRIRPSALSSPTSSPTSSASSKASDVPGDGQDLEKGDETSDNETQQPQYEDIRLPPGVQARDRAALEELDDMQEVEKTRSNPQEISRQSRTTERESYQTLAITLSAATTRTQASTGAAFGRAITGVDVRDRTTHEGEKGGLVFVVGYQGANDPMDPHNWGVGIRVFSTFIIASIGFVVGVASSIDSSAIPHAAPEFHVSEVVESLATGLYLIGFGVGALFAGPFSETLGRNPVYITTLGLYMIFIMASGLAPNIGAQLAFRFLAGFFGSTPLVCAGGSISDLWNPMERVLAFPSFALAAFMGPLMGPVLGGYIVSSRALGTWRWTEWITLIMSGLVLILVVLFQPETYPSTLLRWRAAHLRRVTGDSRFRAQAEIRSQTFLQRLATALYRPFLLTLREPIISLVALYLSVIYIVLFTFLDGYNYIFAEIHGTSEGVTGLCFLGIIVGLVLASCLVPLIYTWSKRDLKKIQEQGGNRIPPEFRLWFAMLGGAVAIPVSLFWMGWTSYSWISIWSPLGASVLFGYGVLCIFISSYQYIIDSYEIYAASALASVTLIRYVAAGGMTVVGIPFYRNLGVHWTLTILGCISALMVPVPYVFYMYGAKIREKSRYAAN